MNDNDTPTTKAGVVIYGKNRMARRAFVAPYNEGRFASGEKTYVVPKGAVDPGESAFVAGARETKEETGIDIERLLGKDNIEKLSRGEDVRNVDSPGYEGVRIVCAHAQPFEHVYFSRGSRRFPTSMFGIEVENIEALRPHLKNPRNTETETGKNRGKVSRSVARLTADTQRYPKFDDLLQWMRSGDMPKRPWNEGYTAPPLFTKKERHSAFERLERQFVPSGLPIRDPDQWLRFVEWLSLRKLEGKVDVNDHRQVKDSIALIKKHLRSMGVVNSDLAEIKFDDKDAPLRFYQEGADIVSAEDYFTRALIQLDKIPSYGRAFGGDCAALEKCTPQQQLQQSQLACIVPFAEPIDIAGACERSIRAMSRKSRARIPEPLRMSPPLPPAVAMQDLLKGDSPVAQNDQFWRDSLLVNRSAKERAS